MHAHTDRLAVAHTLLASVALLIVAAAPPAAAARLPSLGLGSVRLPSGANYSELATEAQANAASPPAAAPASLAPPLKQPATPSPSPVPVGCEPLNPQAVVVPPSYALIAEWEVRGTQNYSCSGNGTWALDGVKATAVDADTGEQAGFAYTQRGDDGSYYPTYVATDANGAVEGELVTARAGRVEQPSPDPSTDVPEFRAEVFNATGSFLDVLYVVRTGVAGGALSGPCTAGEEKLVGFTATYEFVTC